MNVENQTQVAKYILDHLSASDVGLLVKSEDELREKLNHEIDVSRNSISDELQIYFAKSPLEVLSTLMMKSRAPEGSSIAVNFESIHAVRRHFRRILIACVCGIHQTHGSLPTEMPAMIWKKHQDYGSLPLTLWGPRGILIRIDSKFLRLVNLLANPKEINYESIYDTYADMMAYAFWGIVIVDRTSKGKIE